MSHLITPNSVALMLECQESQTIEGKKHRVQVINVKRIKSDTHDRMRLVLSDGKHYGQALLSPTLNDLVDKGLKENSIVEISSFIINTVRQGQASVKIVVVIGMSIVEPDPGGPIGNPVRYEPGQQQQQQSVSGRIGGGMMDPKYSVSAPAQPAGPIHPIAALNPYQNRWAIKARVTAKSDIRLWDNERGKGKLFSVDLLDAAGGEIKATMFNDAADKFFPVFQVNKVYIISNGHLKPANPRWTRLNNDYEITLNRDAEVRYVGEDESIAEQRFDFVPIPDLQTWEQEFVDVIGVVRTVQPVQQFTARTSGKMLTKRNIQLVDRSRAAVDITLWAQDAEKYDESVLPPGTVLAVKTAKRSEFNGVSLNASFNSQLFPNPDREEAHKLRLWWDAEGKNVEVDSLTRSSGMGGGMRNDPRKYLSQIQSDRLGFNGDKADYFTSRATIAFFKEDMERPPWYQACPSGEHNPKVTPDDHGGYFCERCNKAYPNYQARYILSLICSDASGSTWLTAFDDSATQILGKRAADLVPLVERKDEAAFKDVFRKAVFQSYVFKIACKAEPRQDDMRVRSRIVSVEPVDYKAEARMLLEQIAKYD